MTVRDSAAERSSGLGIVHSQSAAVLLPEELPHVAEQSVHVGACVIAGNIGVQVLPRSFDPVVVRTVRRQKMQSDPAAEAGERHPRDLTVVNPVVIENHVNHRGLRTLRRELGQQGDEQRTGFTLAFDPNQRAGADVQRSRQITLDVLARRRDFLLLALHHPIPADLRIQVNVHLVLVERALVVRHRGQQATNFRQAPALGDRRPRAAHRRPWSAPPRLDQGQGPAHGRHVNANARLAFHRLEQKFTRPGRTPPAVLLRRRPHQPIQHVELVLVELGGAVVFAAIEEAAHAHGAEAIGHAIDRGVVDGEPARRLAGTPAAGEVEDDQVADTQLGRATGMQIFEEPLLDEITQFADNRRHGNSLPWGVSPREHSHGEFPFSSRTTDSENCSNVQLNRARSFSWRRWLKTARLSPLPDGDAPAVVLECDEWGHRNLGRDYYALIEGRFDLIRTESNGGSFRNWYDVNHWRRGPAPPPQPAERWEEDVCSKDRAHVLRAMLWLGGRHALPQEPGPVNEERLAVFKHQFEDDRQIDLVRSVRARPRVVARLRELAESKDEWIREAATFAQRPDDVKHPASP